MGRKYANSPIMEVVCEIRFGVDSEWDMAVPGLIYERVKDTLPKRQQHKAFAFKPSPDAGLEWSATDRMQFRSEDELSFIQVSPYLLAVNRLAPYPLWENYFSLVQTGFNAYREVTRPSTIERIGLRYINKIHFEDSRVELENFFNFYPFIGFDTHKDMVSFQVATHTLFADGRDRLKIELASRRQEQESNASIFLDLDYVLGKPGSIAPDGVLDWVNEAHQRIEETFEACIQDSLRAKFDAVRDEL